MSKEIPMDVASRPQAGKNVSRRLRREGRVPAVVYGMRKPVVSISVDRKELQGVLSSDTGENTVFRLRLDGEKEKTRHVMIREQQIDPVTGVLVHVDFVRVDMDRQVQVEVPLEIVGVAEGVKNQGGLMDFVVRSVQITCLPGDIPEHIPIDVNPLSIGDVFRAKDLRLDSRTRILTDPEQALVVISAPVVEAEVAAEEPEAAPEGAEPEVIQKGKEEGAPESPDAPR